MTLQAGEFRISRAGQQAGHSSKHLMFESGTRGLLEAKFLSLPQTLVFALQAIG